MGDISYRWNSFASEIDLGGNMCETPLCYRALQSHHPHSCISEYNKHSQIFEQTCYPNHLDLEAVPQMVYTAEE